MDSFQAKENRLDGRLGVDGWTDGIGDSWINALLSRGGVQLTQGQKISIHSGLGKEHLRTESGVVQNDHKFVAAKVLFDELPQRASIDSEQVSADRFHELLDRFA
jgi:hypothetical protein